MRNWGLLLRFVYSIMIHSVSTFITTTRVESVWSAAVFKSRQPYSELHKSKPWHMRPEEASKQVEHTNTDSNKVTHQSRSNSRPYPASFHIQPYPTVVCDPCAQHPTSSVAHEPRNLQPFILV